MAGEVTDPRREPTIATSLNQDNRDCINMKHKHFCLTPLASWSAYPSGKMVSGFSVFFSTFC